MSKIQTPDYLDANDPLAHLATDFLTPPNKTYLCGHSLGPLPRELPGEMNAFFSKWHEQGVEGHFTDPYPWMPYHELLLPDLAAMTNSHEDEVVPMNSLTTNLHLLLLSFYKPTSQRYKILVEPGLFPSDYQAVLSQIKFHQQPDDALLFLPANPKSNVINEDEVISFIHKHGEEIAVVLLPGVQYLTGQVFPIEKITRAAKAKGCTVGWDLAHAFANIPLHLHSWNVDFAVWCHYKYGNSGPGAVAGAFVHRNHIENDKLPRLAGWWGEDPKTRFAMQLTSNPMPSAGKWQLSNPPILALLPVLISLRSFAKAGYMKPLREKSLALTSYMLTLLEELTEGACEVITPVDSRGSQLSLRLRRNPEAISEVFSKLAARDVIVDLRKPDIIRVASAPLYNSFRDVHDFVSKLALILRGE